MLQLWQNLRNYSALTLPPQTPWPQEEEAATHLAWGREWGVRGTMQEIKIQKFHLSTIKTSHCFNVSKCIQELLNSLKPQQSQTLWTRNVRLFKIPQGHKICQSWVSPQCPSKRNLPDRLQQCQEAMKPASWKGGWIGKSLCYIFSWDFLILWQVNFLLKKKKLLWWQLHRPQSCSYLQCFPEQDGQWAKSWRLGSLRRIRTLQKEMCFHGLENITKYTEMCQLKDTKSPWIPSPLGECRVPGFKDMSSV